MMLQPIWPLLAGSVVLLAATVLWAVRGRPHRSRTARAGVVARLVLALLAVGITLHPVGTLRVSVPRQTTVDVVIVLDRTTSMGARDYDGGHPRMDGAAADLTALAGRIAGARIAVIVFDDDARLAVPFTTDTTSLAVFFDTVGWRPSAKATGSDISVAAALTEQTLRQAAADRPEHRRYVVYAGDGEQTAATAPGGFDGVQDLVTDALVLGYGTAAGGPMATSDDGDELVRIGGEVQVSRADEGALRAIAGQLGGSYAHRTAPDGLPDLVPPGTAPPATEVVPGQEYSWVLAVGAGGVLLLLVGTAVAGLRAVREEVAGAPR
ncbi:vWA domain-containing protein [Pimelobacter simplex]|uniref:vWA domain-containing protein n=1 Tax=Nocardioides simplex TaxID=2045 RepID=UPI003AAF49B6